MQSHGRIPSYIDNPSCRLCSVAIVAIILQCFTLTKLQLTRYVENCIIISVCWYLSCLYVESFIALPCAMLYHFSVSCIKNLYPACMAAKAIN